MCSVFGVAYLSFPQGVLLYECVGFVLDSDGSMDSQILYVPSHCRVSVWADMNEWMKILGDNHRRLSR